MIFLTDQMLIHIKQKAGITAGTVGLTDADILNIATRRLQIDIANEILDKKEEYLLTGQAIPLVANQDYYRIPYRSLGSTIRHIYYVSGNGTARFPLNRMYHEDLESVPPSLNYSEPRAFLLEGSNIRLIPSVGSTANGTIYIEYFFRPNQLVSTIYCRQIASLDIVNQIATFTSMPSQLASGTTFDIINHISGNEVIQFDVTGTVTSNTITFTTPLSNFISVGNWVALAQQSPVPNIPEEFQQLLLAYTVLDIEQIRGSQSGIQVAQQDIMALRKAVSDLTRNRVQSKPELVIPRNPIARGAASGKRWGRW